LQKGNAEFPGVGEARLRMCISAIHAERKSLAKSKIAVHWDGFQGEDELPYTREEADRIRTQHGK
jgi:hypothetical protein